MAEPHEIAIHADCRSIGLSVRQFPSVTVGWNDQVVLLFRPLAYRVTTAFLWVTASLQGDGMQQLRSA